ncbi:tRNA (adenosine(37)-N6)-threonylcarbamoyltransferase complex transferase subunit TsaD [Candidatus Epulonipiscium fishelsonii]|uniref:tRNA (Adenosine(37)-N6)-threonylcarbamoyltransferase complex transferase subunit TsaD n=1 Tax=Candidatus Epulonipiscium fishelsonii TaxID=77094 RepID=A0ACC8XEU2_9FIRM|nr:tRNA (adenosine(37)-N6)-threonylcarbamoyltransferase complex transferase subunit TsaD [Epulopiscium sp. SCG-B05WGA-EpuloA1]ONI41758.1 tRNA (adenosine(37)-N6)-threonylcarbamoyltransferase complex transferase subunit TsaD [Epulopiscium sp. SCG-B11WGA-EpuloA1]
MKILAIETSCDETAVAIVEDGRKVLSNVIATQIDLHKKFGGVVPEVASRMHVEKINYIIKEALQLANLTLEDINAVGVTYGPGLVGALLVGVVSAKAISFAKNIPLIGVHHIEGHISANYIEYPDLEPPFLCLVVSGGHTHLIKVNGYTQYQIIGKTRDDAVGEAYDKVARTMGLTYPGGPKIDELSKMGNASIPFPKAMLDDGYDFSFSGIKSSVLNYINSCKMKNEEINVADIATSFQQTVIDILVHKTMKLAKEQNFTKIALAGGVASNNGLRTAMKEECSKNGYNLYIPSPKLCTDNAAMIGSIAYYRYKSGIQSNMSLNAVANLPIDLSF